jgi:hypothetical protein
MNTLEAQPSESQTSEADKARLVHLPKQVLAELDETMDHAEQLDMKDLVRAVLWHFEQQPQAARDWIVLDYWLFGGLFRTRTQRIPTRGGKFYELVRSLFAKVCAYFRR